MINTPTGVEHVLTTDELTLILGAHSVYWSIRALPPVLVSAVGGSESAICTHISPPSPLPPYPHPTPLGLTEH